MARSTPWDEDGSSVAAASPTKKYPGPAQGRMRQVTSMPPSVSDGPTIALTHADRFRPKGAFQSQPSSVAVSSGLPSDPGTSFHPNVVKILGERIVSGRFS